MKQKIKEKRVLKGYKIADTTYKMAMRRAKKEKKSLATLVELFVTCYGTKIPYLISPVDSDNGKKQDVLLAFEKIMNALPVSVEEREEIRDKISEKYLDKKR